MRPVVDWEARLRAPTKLDPEESVKATTKADMIATRTRCF
eukprot:CAMPEP_0172667396 /NCGR_PEP_ID=MMETSP1074-20121228/8393_1 /TAXON_ID=2916 /ORGANISM="Ceratium fusus, Strain PA161109" /LENGTH=39 /DNA_ID= /DNA_START= /DNA_END= /DNA_ORIENTATION=